MTSLTVDQKQQRLTNILLAGNLYKSHQITKKLEEVSKLQKISIGVSVENLRVNKQIADGIQNLNQKLDLQINQQQRAEAETRKVKLLKDIIFNISEETQNIKDGSFYPLEKYFLYSSLDTELIKNEIDSSLSDDFNDKKFISETIKTLKNEITLLLENFNDDEKSDLEIILGILEVDEEKEIKKIESNIGAWAEYFIVLAEDYFNDQYRLNKCWPIDKDFKISKNEWNKVKKNEQINGNDLSSSLYSKILDKNDREMIQKFGTSLDEEILELESNFWIDFYSYFYFELSEDQINKYEKIISEYNKGYSNGKIPALETMKPNYLFKFGSKNHLKMSTGSIDINIVREYFFNKFPSEIDEIFNLMIKSLKNCFKNEINERMKDKEKIDHLKSDIEKEKLLTKEIMKKHKFVKEVLSSRI